MKRTLLVLGMILALAMTSMANVEPTSMDAEITSPTAGELIYENTLELRATEPSAAEDAELAWAVRSATDNPTCGTSQPDLAGWKGPHDDAASWVDLSFSADIDVSTWEAGEYCFAFNPAPFGDFRDTVFFYIVDEYAKVGGTIQMGEALRGNSPTHSFDGVVGNISESETVGSITVNDRDGVGYCTLTPTSLNIAGSAAGGDRALMRVDSTCLGDNLDFRVLDRDNDSDSLTRGGVYFPELGLTGEPEEPFFSWVPMDRGNNHVGTR